MSCLVVLGNATQGWMRLGSFLLGKCCTVELQLVTSGWFERQNEHDLFKAKWNTGYKEVFRGICKVRGS